MNERIDKLMVKAGAYFGGEGVDYSNFEPEKFAELIVKKCANIVWDEAEKTSNSDVNDAGYKIIEHFFGVEE